MPRPLSHSRRHRGHALHPRPSHWRPRVSSPLTSEIVYCDKEEESDSTCISIDTPTRNTTLAEEENTPRPRLLYITISLLIDCLLSFCLCRMALDNLMNLRYVINATPPEYHSEGKVMFCLPHHSSDPRFVSLADYPKIPAGKSLSDFVDMPSNCNFLPTFLVNLAQSASLASFVPLLVTCFITLKLAFGLLLLRTSPNPRAPLNYLKKTTFFHLLFTYFSILYVKLNFKSLLNRYPALEKMLTMSSEFMFFILGFLACLFVLSLAVVPLLWIFSSSNNDEKRGHADSYSTKPSLGLPTSNSRFPTVGRNPLMVFREKSLSAIPKQKKRVLSSKF